MATIFVDEAGHTGSNLLDPVQPVFVLASHDFDESEAQGLKSEFFGFTKADSLKFTQLARKPRGQAAVLAFLDAVGRRFRPRFKTHIIHKPFAVICKLVDHVVEPSMHNHGVDLYERGANLAVSNALYLITRSLAGGEYLGRLLDAAQRVFTDDTLAGAADLVAVLEEKTGLMRGPRQSGPLAGFLQIPHLALLDLGPEGVAHLGKGDILISFPTALLLMSTWTTLHGTNLDVIHDQSSVMLRQFDEWAKMTDASVPPTLVGMDRRTVQYPIGVRSTRFEPDEKWAGLQLADLVAGAMAKALAHVGGFATNPPDDFEQKLIERITTWKVVDKIWPEAKFTPQALGTIGPQFADPFDFYGRVMAK